MDKLVAFEDGYVAINYEKEYVRIHYESEEHITMKELPEAFGKTLIKKETIIGEEYWFSMAAFSEIFNI